MSLSLIRTLLTEAPEDLTLPEEPVSAASVEGKKLSQADFSPPPAPVAMAQNLGAAPTFATGQAGQSTIQKEVVNKQMVLAICAALKATVATLEKTFDGDDFDKETANIYIHDFLQNLAFHADKLSTLVSGEESQEDLEQPIEEPVAQETSGLSEPVEAEAPSEFTNPSEAI